MRAIDSKTREPISGLLVSGWTKGNRNDEAWSSGGTPSSKGDLRHPPVTDEDGRAELEVPADLGLFVHVHRRNVAGVDNKFVEVAPLRTGERRDLLVEIDVGIEVRLFGRVVDANDSKPIVGALVRACFAPLGGGGSGERDIDRLARTTTDATGGFQVLLPEMSGIFVRIEASGFGVAALQRLQGHDSPERALVVQLQESATLEAEVHDAGGAPIPGVTLQLSADGNSLPPDAGTWVDVDVPRERWSGMTTADGRCTIAGISPGIAIAIELKREGRLVRREEEDLELEPGQVLRREWVLGGGATLNGLVLDQDSRPVPKLEIWLSRWDPEPEHYFQTSTKASVASTTVTDTDGRFRFSDVEAGACWLGPAPHDQDWAIDAFGDASKAEPPSESIAPVASQVEVLSGASQDVTLRVHRGLFIRGKVLVPDGQSAKQANVVASRGSSGWGPHAESHYDGVFAIGPLSPGTYSVIAESTDQFADSDPVEAQAGSSQIILRLKVGGGLHGVVIDSRTGKPCAAEMTLTPRVPSKGIFGNGMGFGVQEDGIVDRQGLLPGDYDLAARTEDGCFGSLSGISVVAGEKVKEFVLSVSPGGTLKISYEGEHPFADVSFRLQGVLLAFPSSVHAGKWREMHAPAGSFALEFRSDLEAPVKVRNVHLDPGEVKEIQLTDGG